MSRSSCYDPDKVNKAPEVYNLYNLYLDVLPHKCVFFWKDRGCYMNAFLKCHASEALDTDLIPTAAQTLILAG